MLQNRLKDFPTRSRRGWTGDIVDYPNYKAWRESIFKSWEREVLAPEKAWDCKDADDFDCGWNACREQIMLKMRYWCGLDKPEWRRG